MLTLATWPDFVETFGRPGHNFTCFYSAVAADLVITRLDYAEITRTLLLRWGHVSRVTLCHVSRVQPRHPRARVHARRVLPRVRLHPHLPGPAAAASGQTDDGNFFQILASFIHYVSAQKRKSLNLNTWKD